MTYDARKLRGAELSLEGHLRRLQGLSQRLIEHEEFSQIADDVEFYTKELPDLLPVFDRYSLGTSDRSYGVRAGIQAYLDEGGRLDTGRT